MLIIYCTRDNALLTLLAVRVTIFQDLYAGIQNLKMSSLNKIDHKILNVEPRRGHSAIN